MTNHPGFPGVERVAGMWDFGAKTRKVPGKPGQTGPPTAYSRATFSTELMNLDR